jgi:hypothetical protein
VCYRSLSRETFFSAEKLEVEECLRLAFNFARNCLILNLLDFRPLTEDKLTDDALTTAQI